jgi:hypothetical protein
MMDRRAELVQMLESLERDAYARGWQDCAAKMAETVSQLAPAPGKRITRATDAVSISERVEAHKSVAASVGGGSPLKGRVRANSAAAFVLRALGERQGLAYSEMVQAIVASGAPTNEPAIRTATKRLRRDERIRLTDGRFYLMETAGTPAKDAPAALFSH